VTLLRAQAYTAKQMSSVAPKPVPTPEEVLEVALRLPREQRLRLAEQLCASVEDEAQSDLEIAWAEEIADRVEALERGEVETVGAKAVFERIRAKHAR
jgi:putative addiction module component (TIGR02574 family)